MGVRLITSDVFEGLSQLEDESVHCVVTSPPYWGLRNYGGIDGQLGQESSLGEHLDVMVRVMREVRRVLRADGTLWLNYGDSFAAAPNGRSAADTKAAGTDDRTFRDKPFSTVGPIYRADAEPGSRLGKTGNKGNHGSDHRGRVLAGGVIKPKDKCLIPHRLAIALQDDGWWVRQDIVFFKKNPMPESVADRPTTAHEYVFLLSKSARYWYDAEAVKSPYKEVSIARLSQPTFDDQTGGAKDSKTGNRSHRKALENQKRKMERKADKQRGHGRRHAGFNDRWDRMSKREQQEMGANLRSVWPIATYPYPGAHFATFPPALVEPCILAGCPKGGVVLDPFGGSGTVGLVADRLQRHAILIELNPEYMEMARRRIEQDAGIFGSITEGGTNERQHEDDDLPCRGLAAGRGHFGENARNADG